MTNNSPLILSPDIIVENSLWDKVHNLEKMVNEASNALTAHLQLEKYFSNADFSVLLTDDKHIKSLNNEYRGKDNATDVLSFPTEELNYLKPEEMKVLNNSTIGDIVISFETLEREALEQNKNFNDHFKHLLIHSMLHLLGFNHDEEIDAKIMEREEIKILAKINIKSPYE